MTLSNVFTLHQIINTSDEESILKVTIEPMQLIIKVLSCSDELWDAFKKVKHQTHHR